MSHRLPDGTVPVLVSAASPDLLRADVAALLHYLTEHPGVTPDAVAAMLFRTRDVRRHRTVALVRDRAELLTAWQAVVDGRDHPGVHFAVATAGRVGLVFPGQGGQRPGMGRLYYDTVPAYRAEADRCAAAFPAAPLRYLLDDDCPDTGRAGLVQPALFIQMAALAAMWRDCGIAPAAVIGHSQGEIAAAYVAGAVTLDDAARAVMVRAAAVDAAATDDFAMAVIAADQDRCTAALAGQPGWAEVSVVNSPGLTGISGDRDTVAAVVDSFTAAGTFARLLRVGYPAHTSWIDRIGDRVLGLLSASLEQPRFADTGISWFGGTLGGPADPELSAAQYWLANLRNTVRFDRAVAAAAADRVSTLVELSEHPTLQLAVEENLAAAGVDGLVVGTSERTAADLSAFSRNLIRVALRNPAYRWELLAGEPAGVPTRPLPDFPTSAMSRMPLWLPYDSGPAQPAQQNRQPESGTPRLLIERWDRLTRRSLTPPRSLGLLDWTGRCADLADGLCDAAADLGATARRIESGSGDYPTLVVFVPADADTDAVARFFVDRPWADALTAAVTDCWLVTVGGEPVGENTAPCAGAAGIAAGFRSVGAEHPRVAFRHLDLPIGPIDPTAVIAALHTAGESELALRDGALHVKRIVEPPAETEGGAAPPPDHALILGGTGNLGLEFAEHFARLGARRLTLVNRSGAAGERVERLRAATKTAVDVVACDITDPAATAELADRCRDAPVDLIVHAAMAYRDLDSAAITAPDAAAMLQTKVVAAQHIIDTVPRTGHCRVLLCSSLAATIGGRGQVLYAAANRMLDALADHLRADGVDCVSVQWGQWSTLDLSPAGFAKLTATGILPMPPRDALAVGLNRLRRNTVVAAFDLTRARPVLSAYGYGLLLADLDPDGDADLPAASPAPPMLTGGDLEDRLLHLLAGAIGVENVADIDTGLPMVAIGLDSLQALEFHRRVKAELDHDLAVADLLGGASIADVLGRIRASAGG
ncbi:nocobactin polyketide synthase NbtC [Mycobacterium sp. M1]|uniref:Nocobactin polyketide synthase NbtC n=1 Tax=Mycolicibacter acidiphilus TaxID=2835306 RepID=A0ABS5RJS3_9MYCO|nr:nocobactin polyketide synthase NbtC [Mycolicibacter acidiphilus]MBS9534543.1 nocobactin polyketide synthase NbtC [Mycolicibacter acidiphilus]